MQTTSRKLAVTWALVIFLLFPALGRADTAVQAWVQRYDGSGLPDQPFAVAVDGSNNVIVTGSAGFGYFDYIVAVQYSSAGIPLWTNRCCGPDFFHDYAWSVAADSSNSVIVAGGYNGDFTTIKYSSAGDQLWINTYNGPWAVADRVTALVVDGSDNVIVTGCSTCASTAVEYWENDYVTIKYSSTGEQLWLNTYDGPGNADDLPKAVAVDRSNNVIVTGRSAESWAAPHHYGYATIKYSSDGVPLWTNRFNDGSACALAVDGSNNVIVTGGAGTIKYSGAGLALWTNYYPEPGGNGRALAVDGSNNVIILGDDSSYATFKYSSDGVPLWTNHYNGPSDLSSWPKAVAVDPSNNVIVTGVAYGYDGASTFGYATVAYSSAGLPLWTNRYSNLRWFDDPIGVPLATDHSGNVIVLGYFYDGTSERDFVTIKYSYLPVPVLTGLKLGNGAFQLRVDNVLQPGTLLIEASTDLADWAPVFTNTTPTNVLFYTEPDAGSSPTRFYRAFQFP